MTVRRVFLCVLLLLSASASRLEGRPFPPLYPGPLFERAIESASATPAEGRVTGLITPHHLLAADLIAAGFAMIKERDLDRIIILTPDHYHRGRTIFSVPGRDFLTALGPVPLDREGVERLKKLILVGESNLFSHEHGVQALLPFVARLFPGVPVLPVAIGTRSGPEDWRELGAALAPLAGEGALVVTDGVFSAEGEIAKLDEIVPIVKKHSARLFVDDAHALGVIGPGGKGSAAHFGLVDQVDLIGGTFSKSMASIGGWLVGDRKVLDYIRHFAPSYLFAASAAPPSVAAAMEAFAVMQEEPWRIDKLRENFTYMRDELRRLGFELGKTETAVIPIYIRQDLRTLRVWRELLEDYGIYTNPFISPGVPPKNAMLRTSYMATHERTHLDRGLEAFEKVGKKYGVIS